MALIDALRQQFPMYDEKSDEELIEGYRKKFHPNRTVAEIEGLLVEKERTEREKLKDETSFFDAFTTGLYRGTRQTGALLGDALPAIAADLVGADDYRDRQLQEYQETMADIEAKAPSAVRTFRDIDDVGDAGLYAAETIGQFIPSIVTSLGGGFVGGFLGRKAAEGFARKLVGDAAEAAVKKGKGIGFVAGTFAGSGSQTIPEAYTSIAEETGEPAAATALVVGSINAALDSILPVGVAKALGKDARDEVARSLFTRLMIGGGKGAAVEGLTEGVQEANNLIAAQLLKDNPEFFTQENVDRILDAGLRGMIGGKAFGLVSGIPGESPQQREAREKAEAQQQLRDDIQTVRTDIEQGGQEVIARSMPDPDVPLLDVPQSERILNQPVPTTIDRSGEPVMLSGRDLIEFAENNRNVDPQIPEILDRISDPVQQAQLLRTRFREIYTGPEYIGQTSRMRTGQPNPEEQQRRAAEAAAGGSKGGGKGAAVSLLPEEGQPRAEQTLQPSRFAIERLGPDGTPSYQRVSAEEAAAVRERLRANPDPTVKVIETPVTPGRTDPAAIAQTTPILTPEGGVSEFAGGSPGTARIPERVSQEEMALLPEIDRQIETLRAMPLKQAASRIQTIEKIRDQVLSGQRGLLNLTMQQALRTANNSVAELQPKAEFKQAAMDGNPQFEVPPDFDASAVEERNDLAAAKTVDGVEDAYIEAKATYELLSNEVNRGGVTLEDIPLEGTRKEQLLRNAMSGLTGRTNRLITGATDIAKGRKQRGKLRGKARVAEDLTELKKDIAEARALLQEDVVAQADAARTGAAPAPTPTPDPAPASPINDFVATIQGPDSLRKRVKEAIEGRRKKALDSFFDEGDLTEAQYDQAYDLMPAKPSLIGTKVTGFKTQEVMPFNPRRPEKRQEPTDSYPVVEVSDGVASRYLMWIDPAEQGPTVLDVNWQEVDQFGEVIESDFSRVLPEKKTAKKEAVALLKEEMVKDVKASGDPVRLQNLVDAKLIKEDEALGLIDPTKASAATGAPAAPQAAPAAPQARVTPEQLEAANRRIQERIDALRASGDQGGILARAVEQAVRRRGISVEQAVTIFDTADVLNEILPQRSRDRIRFVQQLMDRGGAAEGSGGEAGGQVAGLNTSRTQDVTNGIIELSLALSPETVRSTAAHEAFHTLQDYFAAYDKGSEKILDAFFGKPRQQVEYDRSGAAKFIRRLNPEIDRQLRGKTLNAGEIAAYTFQAFDQARREGKNIPGTGGPVRRFLNMLSQFFPRMKNLVMGRGFRSVQDVMRDASTGRTAQRFAGQERPVVGAAPQASTLLTTDTSVRDNRALGLLPFLRFKTDKKFDHPRKINASVNPSNAERQIDNLDGLLNDHPNTLASEKAFADFLSDAMGKDNKDGSVPMPPFRAIQMANNPAMIAEQIGGLTQGQREMAQAGFDSAEKFRLAYEGGLAEPEHTGKLILWGILSRGVSPFVQESLFLDVVQERGNKAGVGKFIKDAAEGNFDLDAYLDWVKTAIPENSPGAGATHNLNAFGTMTLAKMSKKGPDGLTMLQKFHNLVADQSLSGKQVRREFHKMNTSIGINNKVVSFMLLVSGRNDVLVLDRVQFRNLFNDGRLGDYNLYDGVTENKKAVTGSSIQKMGDDTMGLMMYEALERDLLPAVRKAYKMIGREADASMGRFHWESWVASSAQEVDHGTIDGIIHDAMGIDQPYNSITTKEGRYIQFKGGSVYGYKENGQPYVHIPDGLGNMFEFTSDKAQAVFERLSKKLKSDGILPSKFQISQNKEKPYYERDDIDNAALSGLLQRQGGQLVQPRVRGSGQGNTDGTGPDAQGTTQASAVLEVRASATPQSIGQTGRMIDVIARQDTEGVLRKAREGFSNYFRSGRWIDDNINRFQPLAELDKLANDGEIGLATTSAFKMAELATNNSGRSEFSLMHGNLTYDRNTGEIGINENSEGLLDIFKSIGSGERYTQFQQYAIARRALTLKDDTRRRVAVLKQQIAAASDKKTKNQLKDKVRKLEERQQRLDDFLTDERIADGMQFESAEFRDVFDRYNKFNQNTLQFLVDTGVISEAQREAMNIDYIPYYKYMEQEEYGTGKKMVRNSILGPRVTQVFNNPDAGIQELTGREGTISDLYENIIKNNNAMINAGLKNVAMQRALKNMETLEMSRRVTERESGNPAVVTYYEDGKKVFMDLAGEDGSVTDFNQRMFMALSSFSPPQLTGLMDIVQKVTSIFRNAITLAPNFMLANLIRGDIAGFVTVTEGQKPIFGTLKGFKNVLQNDSVSEEMKAISGVGGYAYGQDSRDFANVFKRKIDPQTNVVAQLRKAIDGLQDVGEASELSTRDGIYRATLERTGSKTEAAYQALNLVNFNRRGNPQTRAGQVLSLLIPMVPFLNARIQGLYRTGTALAGKEADQRKAIARIGMLSAVSTAIWALSSGDDRWDDEPLYRKMNYHILYAGDYRILIPKAFEVGVLAQTLPEVFFDVISGREGGKYVADAAAHTFFNTFSFNPIPQVIRPTLEVYTNYDFFRGREIESARLQNLPKGQRADTTTSSVLQGIGSVTGDTLGLSPVQLEALVRGHLGTLGILSLNTIDTALSSAGLIPAKPDGVMPGGDILGINRFIREGADPSNKWVGEVYDLRREANEIYTGVRALRESGRREAARELMTENRKLLSVRRSVNKLADSLSKITKQINRVRDNATMSSADKKERLNTLINRRNQIAERVERLLDRAGK